MRQRIAGMGLFVMLALPVAGRSGAEPFVPCRHNAPDDRGLRILVEAAFRNNQNTLSVQKMLGQPLTPVRGSVDDVDLLAWCRCVHERRAKALGEELAVAMSVLDPKLSAKYDAWLKNLDPQRQREHVAFLFTTEALCIDEAQR